MSAATDSRPADAPLLTVARGLQVLRAFRSDRSPLSNAELVRRTGLSKATVSRLTSTLLQLGFLRHADGGRHFELAAAPLGMGHAFIESSELLRRVRPCMQELADRLGVSAALAVPSGPDMMYIAYCASARVATLKLGVGSVLPMGMTAIGRAYLWGLPAGEQRSQIARLRRDAAAHAAALERGMRESFAELADTGTCCVSDGYLRDTFGIALPLRLGRQGVPMGMSCGRAAVRPDLAGERKRIVPALRKAAVQLQELVADGDGYP
jgi:IclR family transcriptional regulator, positive regulator for flagellar biogenesis